MSKRLKILLFYIYKIFNLLFIYNVIVLYFYNIIEAIIIDLKLDLH